MRRANRWTLRRARPAWGPRPALRVPPRAAPAGSEHGDRTATPSRKEQPTDVHFGLVDLGSTLRFRAALGVLHCAAPLTRRFDELSFSSITPD